MMDTNLETVIDRTQCRRTEKENAAAAVIVVITSIAGVIGNGLVILSYFVTNYLRSQPINCLIINLAAADFLCGVYIQMPCIANLYNPKWHFQDVACKVHSITMWSIMTASKWTLATISLDRAIALRIPLKYPKIVTMFRMRCIILFIWIYSATVSGLLVNKSNVSHTSWELVCSPKWTLENLSHAFSAAILCFWLPSVILLLSNIFIIYVVRRINACPPSQISVSENEINSKDNTSDHTKTLRCFYILQAVYMIFGAPYFLAKFISINQEQRGLLSPSLMVFYMLLLFISSAINPFIYSLLRKEHRKALKQTVKMLSEKRKKCLLTVGEKLRKITAICKMCKST